MKGKIYRLSNGDKHYYGSTTTDLKERLRQHIQSHIHHDIEKQSTSTILFDSVEYNVSIDLMEEIEYENKDDLLRLERWWIENNECVNKINPIRTKYDYHLSTIKYRNKDREKTKERRSRKIICECGLNTNQENIARHRRSKRHIKLMENKTENIKITITGEQQRHGQAG